MFKPFLFTMALAAGLSSAAPLPVRADERPGANPGPHILYRSAALGAGRRDTPFMAGTPRVDTAQARYAVGARHRRFGADAVGSGTDRPLTERYAEPPLRVAGARHHRRGDAYAGGPSAAYAGGLNAAYVGHYDFDGNDLGPSNDLADGGGFAPTPGDDGYGIPPAGGLAVYSPGAYGPGPRIISIGGRRGVAHARSTHRRRYGGYGIPPAGGLAVYSPGAYGPGPRVISLRHHHAHVARARFGYGYDTGDQGYGIPPAGGLAVYSPGAYEPGPRIVSFSSGWGTTSQQWGCGCGGHAGY